MTKPVEPLFSLCRISHGKNSIPPSALFTPPSQEERSRLIELGAAREPEGAELRLVADAAPLAAPSAAADATDEVAAGKPDHKKPGRKPKADETDVADKIKADPGATDDASEGLLDD